MVILTFVLAFVIVFCAMVTESQVILRYIVIGAVTLWLFAHANTQTANDMTEQLFGIAEQAQQQTEECLHDRSTDPLPKEGSSS